MFTDVTDNDAHSHRINLFHHTVEWWMHAVRKPLFLSVIQCLLSPKALFQFPLLVVYLSLGKFLLRIVLVMNLNACLLGWRCENCEVWEVWIDLSPGNEDMYYNMAKYCWAVFLLTSSWTLIVNPFNHHLYKHHPLARAQAPLEMKWLRTAKLYEDINPQCVIIPGTHWIGHSMLKSANWVKFSFFLSLPTKAAIHFWFGRLA